MEEAARDGLDWFTKAEAVTYTKVSLRTLEREISEGKIRTRQRRQVGRRSVVVLHPEDIERLRRDFTPLSASDATSEIRDATPAGEDSPSQLPVPRAAVETLNALIHNLKPLVKEQRLFLPIKEAAIYSGLPEGYLRKCIQTGKLKPIKHRGHYIRLADLQKL